MEFITATSMKVSSRKYFRGDFQTVNTGNKFDCLLISEYNSTLINSFVGKFKICLKLGCFLILSETLK